MSTKGRSLELYFIDGRPDGMLTAEVFNWTGHVLRTPRTQIAEALRRNEGARTGVYLLIGPGEDRERVYIGEAEDLRSRFRDHIAKKDWWETAVLISTSGDVLHKAHVKYLEARLHELAREVGKARLDNANTPTPASLTEAATANMEAFIETLKMVLPAIGVDAFLVKASAKSGSDERIEAPGEAVFEMRVPKHGLHAKAVLRDGELVVLKGAVVRAEWAGDRTPKTSYWQIHDDLRDLGFFEENEGRATLVSDFAFSSPSAAAAIVAGRSTNGRTAWTHRATGKTYAEWEQAQFEEAST